MTHFVTHLSDADWLRLTRYLAGDASPGEVAEIEQWMAGSPDDARAVGALRQSWEVCRPTPFTGDGEALWGALQEMIRADAGVPVSAITPVPQRTSTRPARQLPSVAVRGWFSGRPLWSSIAALAVAAAVIVVGWGVAGRRTTAPAASAPISTYTTAKGQRATITLPDGSTVILNVASRLDVPADYLAGNHNLRLLGEAMFAVAHHDGVPFRVTAGGTTARVLGTSFVVRHYATDSTVTIAVRDGKVAVRSVVLTAAQQVQVGRTGDVRTQQAPASRFAFTTGALALDGLSLRDAIPELNRWYDADVRFGDPLLAEQHITGNLPAGSLADLTALLELTFGVRVERDGRVLTLYSR